jgi:hypothetical protein
MGFFLVFAMRSVEGCWLRSRVRAVVRWLFKHRHRSSRLWRMYIGFFLRSRAMQRSLRSDWNAIGTPAWEATHAKLENQVDVRLLVSMKLRSVVAAIVVVVMTSVSGWPKVLWHRYCVLQLKFSNPACYLTRWPFPTSTSSTHCSELTAFGFFQRPIKPDRTFAIVRKRTRGFGFGWL